MRHPPASPLRGTILQQVFLTLLLAGCFAFPILLMRGKSATFDEVAHLPAGYSYLVSGAIKINPQHPPLIKELCALPLLFMDLKMPVEVQALRSGNPPLTYQWGFGKRFLYSQDADRILFWGRVPAVLLSVGLAVLIAVWSRRLWGMAGAILSVAIYLLDPTITAHSQLVTTDVGLAFFATLFLFALRGYLESPSRWRLVLAGAALGLALGAKFSAVLLLPIALFLLYLGHRRSRETAEPSLLPDARKPRRGVRRENRPKRAQPPGSLDSRPAAWLLTRFGTLVGVAALVVWALYFFPADPLVYLKGMATVNRDHDPNHFPYLLGETRPGGWGFYLLIAYLVKTPLPELLLLAVSAVLFFRGRRAALLDEAFLILPGLGFFVGYSFAADNLGVRYLIPCFPFFMIFAGRIAPAARQAGAWARAALAALMIWLAAEHVAIWPDHLSYFNQITGIPARGDRWLDDSNLDWGQGLIQLRGYLREHPVQDFRLCYFGSGDPAYYGIGGRPITVKGLLAPPAPGTYILSVHCVARARAELARSYGQASGNWLAARRPQAVVGHVYEVYEVR